MTPTLPAARASARSASSIACSHARPETASPSASGTNSGPNSSSDRKEDRLPLSLEVDVEAQRAVLLGASLERGPPVRGHRLEEVVGAAGEVHARDDVL